MADNTSFVLFTLGPVQGFIKAARTVRDLWSGSYLLSYLTFRAMEAVADQSGLPEEERAKVIVFPNLAELPLWKWKRGQLESKEWNTVLEPCIPNRFLAEVDARHAADLARAADDACRRAWTEIAEKVRAFLFAAHGHPSFASDDRRANLWHQQIDTFFEVYTAVLPRAGYSDPLVENLLGPPNPKFPNTPWVRHHQVAQKLLAAKKGVRHFPVYAPKIPGDVPQKDTLLGTLEHMGPGNRQEAKAFWELAANPKKKGGWHSEGSKVTRSEKLCAVSLVKRFAWAHYFSTNEVFKRNARDLKFSDTATVAAEKWLKTSTRDPRKLVRDDRDELWSGQWLHWSDRNPPDDDPDEDVVPPDVWDAILVKKRAQKKPPSYYAVFVFDGDKMGDRFNAAEDAPMYRTISDALANFALKRIKSIVEGKHHGELIYAGGDDAICVLPTETALACAAEINAAFVANWNDETKSIAKQLRPPELRNATISGGLVVAHYKEDLRFVMEQARDAEKKSKGAGRDALTVTVCRRSGEHSSAVVPWPFATTVGSWVERFLPVAERPGADRQRGASDRWAYKLRADLPVFESDPDMFKLELARQLGRAEKPTPDQFKNSVDEFGKYRGLLLAEGRQKQRKEAATEKDAITDFVTLLQTASFLARGRDE